VSAGLADDLRTELAQPVMPPASAGAKPRTRGKGKAAAGTAAPSEPASGNQRPATPPAVRHERIPLVHLLPNPNNPRQDVGDVTPLADSIRAQGLLQDLVVMPAHLHYGGGALPGDDYVIVAGHRRRAACELAGLTDAPCTIRHDLTVAAALEAMLVENLQREDLSPLEEAAGFKRLLDEGLSQRTIAERVGCNQSHVSRRLALLKLPEQARADLTAGLINAADAAKLAQYANDDEAFEVAWGHGVRGSVSYGAAEAQRIFDARAKRRKLELEGKRVVDLSTPGAKRLYQLDVDLKKHRKLRCHAYYVERYGDGELCTDPASHPKTPTGVPVDQEVIDKRERSKAMKARVAAAQHLEAWPTPPAIAAVHLARALSTRLEHAAALQLAVGWMAANGAPVVSGHVAAGASAYDVERRVLASGDDRLVIRFGMALVLAGRELRTRSTYTRWGDEQARWLHELATRAAYRPTEWERDRLAKHCRIADVGAFLTADDPTPHLPARDSDSVSLHDDLGTEPATDLSDLDTDEEP
jgi:ParB/RepB/Spo0J family partition protein